MGDVVTSFTLFSSASSGRFLRSKGDGAHLLQFLPAAHKIQNENGPWGGAVPKGPLSRTSDIPASLPPRSSRRETPINGATGYIGGAKCVQAILPPLIARSSVRGRRPAGLYRRVCNEGPSPYLGLSQYPS